jgi:hypothetical protein
MVVPWFLQNFLGVDGWGLDGWFLLSNNDYSCILLGLFTCLKWCSILLIERYLAAKLGTNFLISVWRVFFIKRDYA